MKPVVAVVPFGSKATTERRAGAWSRQLARRLVERFAATTEVELRQVFMVSVPEGASPSAGYLVFGSTPDPELAASYGLSLGCSHALTGVLRGGAERVLDLTLVDVSARTAIGATSLPIGESELHLAEPAAAHWLARSLDIQTPADAPTAATEVAYAALLEAMDEEVNATLLATSDAARAAEARDRAAELYLAAVESDPKCVAAEERLLVLAAESLERDDEAPLVPVLEELTTLLPRSWRAHYFLAELRRLSGNVSGAIVAFEHSHALRKLADADLVRLAELYLESGTPGPAAAHVRKIASDSAAYGRAQEILGMCSLGTGDIASALGNFTRASQTGQSAASSRLTLARLLVAEGRVAEALVELNALSDSSAPGPTVAQARRLRFGLLQRPLEVELELAGQAAVGGEVSNLDQALESLERVLAAESNLWEAHFGVGLIARRQGDAQTAEAAFRRALELWPEQPDAMHELGVVLMTTDRTNEATRALESAALARPDDPGYVADAGFAQLRSGNLSLARERLEHAQTLDPSDPITTAYLGELTRIESDLARPN